MKTLPACGHRPVQNYVVVLLDQVAKETAGGIVLPDVVIKPATEGVVVAVGPGLYRKSGVFVPMSVRVGDRVTVSGMGQTPISHDGVDFKLMREPEILLVHDDASASA